MAQNNQVGKVSKWVGWVYFAGVMMEIMGIFQAIAGLVALLNKEFYVASPNHLVAFNYTAWGWIHLIVGIVVIAAGSAVINGHAWGRIVGVLLASVSMVANFLFIPAYPVWSVIAITVNVLVIFALIVHGREAQEA